MHKLSRCLWPLTLVSTLLAQELPDPRDDDGLAEFVARAVPAIEAASGRRFRQPPIAVLADTTDLRDVLRGEMEPTHEAFFAAVPRRRLERALLRRSELLAGMVMGKYAFAARQVLVRPASVPLQLVAAGLDDAPETAVLQLVIVHELVHALQDQEVGLRARFAALRTDAETNRLSRLVEGHAVWCSERAAAALGIETAIAPLRRVFAGEDGEPGSAGAALFARRARGRGILLYLESSRWLAEQHRDGGDDRLWQLLAQEPPPLPPPAQEPEVRDLSGLLDGLSEQLGGANWTCGKGPFDEIDVLAENLVERLEMGALLRGKCSGGAAMMALGVSDLIWRQLQLLTFADERSAQQFVAMAERGAVRDVEKVFGDEELEVEPGPSVPGGGVARVLVQPHPPGGIAASIAWYRRGADVVQITCCSALGDAVQMAKLAGTVFDRVAAARQPPQRDH